MKIKLHQIKVSEVVDNYKNNYEDNSVVGYGGKLNIRPKYQREFVYKDKQRDEVINTLIRNFPLNVMYWCKNDEDSFEVLDGQQRTISICEYVDGKFSFNGNYFHSLTDEEREKVLNYELMVYICEGTDREKLDWFKIINIAGEKLTDQELRNAVYTGEWLTDAKRYFSKNGCPAYRIGEKLLSGSSIRQEYLETAIDWISNGNIEEYMSKNQHNSNASELWDYFQKVVDWVGEVFIKYRKEMKGLEWGFYYNKYKDLKLNSKELENKIATLMMDEDVSRKSGIYEYLLSGNQKYLSIRAFTDIVKRETYEKQKGVCCKCKNKFEIEEMEADHITPWSKGGKSLGKNCQMLCKDCNRRKSDV